MVTNCDHLIKLKFSKTLPYAFNEHGALMVATVLNTQRAVEVSLYVVRAFVKLRELLASNKELAAKLNELDPISIRSHALRVKNADAAMYQAKALGRNNYQFFGQM